MNVTHPALPGPRDLSFLRFALAACLAATLVGCASVAPSSNITVLPSDLPGTPAQAAPGQPGAPAESSTTLPVPGGEIGSERPLEVLPPVSANRAVVALLERARQESDSGRRESAGASLERALRIEPRNAWLWHELARLRLTQGQYPQAISLALKSNSLGTRQRDLQVLNWNLIADARTAQGDTNGAAQARKLAEQAPRP